ncbi:HPt (histidine-containing phosphotransfer) domain-containing protein [Allosphingosinicella indica]|uniref:HPt (Histidine-containing phosphotransfer) domain-containing protein n=2 Tax=Allosphingosinicella indica TaxID=941907 RepID=A0A1X7GWA4_9SPHN|nr:HPt (histidine-containing phosphotransfer) domain-containing protein [Allosphingosinicella indica]
MDAGESCGGNGVLTLVAYAGRMVYDPGALNASLAAAVGTDGDLMAELRAAFLESAERQADLLARARCDANWTIAASRLKSVAASFGVTGLMDLAEEALTGAPSDPVILRRIQAALTDFRGNAA